MDNISEENKKIWGDVDFIEESCPFSNEPLEFNDTEELSISESNTTCKQRRGVIGVVKGCMAPIGQLSRNGRLYESNHWSRVLSNPHLQERIAGRKFFGMISHENKKIDDSNFKNGEISHICSILEVREDDNGKPYLYGELEILDTPAGRILKAMYEGGAGLYVSTRAAGKLLEAAGKPYKVVDANSYYIDSIDFVLNPGFLQAKPVYEDVKNDSVVPNTVSESTQEQKQVPVEDLLVENIVNSVCEQSDERVEKVLDKRSEQVVNSLFTPGGTKVEPYVKARELADKRAERHGKKIEEDPNTGKHSHVSLEEKLEDLTKIVEKVVNDIYEVPSDEIVEQLSTLLEDPSISEEAYEEITTTLLQVKPELTEKILENSKDKFNAEFADKTGSEVSYYRFGGSKPYKVVPKGTDYFAASYDAPRFRTLKQAQKHIKDTYYNQQTKPVKEALTGFVELMANSNISEEAFSSILDMMKGSIK